VNALAFEEATKIIGGGDAIEEFLVCGVCPLSDGWDFKVETTGSPVSKGDHSDAKGDYHY
jgi:hypothetical protein